MIQRPSLAPGDYKVPERSGEVLIDPPLERLPALLDAGRERDWGRAEILGTALGEFRRQVRVRALSIATCPAPVDAAAPLVVMGHQPLFFHPGVWFKFFLLTGVHERWGATGLHLLVDTDAPGAIAAEIPARTGELTRRTETLLDLPADVPLEATPVPPEQEWHAFCARVGGHLATLAPPAGEIRANFDAFVASAARAREGARTLCQFFAGARRTYEARATPPRYAELAVSALSDTREFSTYALHLMQDPAGFRARYNASLDEYRRLHRLRSAANPFPNLGEAYRRLHRLRSAANPFPNLGEAGGFQEVPFWVLREGRRVNLFAQRGGDRLSLRIPGVPLLDLPAGPAGVDVLRASPVRIRPKALALTMFARLCLGDLFIHGVGGGRYDRVTDAVIAEMFGCAPPPYFVATATLMLPLSGEGTVAEDGRVMERRLMDLRHNPERYLAAPSEAQRRLVDEKWSLIRAVEQMRRGPERRAATHRIREVNDLLAQGLAGEIHRVEATLATLGRSSAAQAASYRGYPFFLFDPARVDALASASTRPT